MKSTLSVKLIIEDKEEETTHRSLKNLIDNGKYKSEYIFPWLDVREPVIIITEI